MNIRTKTHFAPILLVCLLAHTGNLLYGQSSMPEVLDTGTITEQLDYLQQRTRIYNNFRAIREDMFQKIKINTIDSLRAVKNNVLQLEEQLREQSTLIQTLQADLQNTNDQLDRAIKNRDRLTFLGIPMHKALYNTIMWAVIAALAFLSGILFLSNKRLFTSAKRNKSDLEETREEFETHRKESRERQEQLVVKHHNELRKLKGN